MGWEWYWCQMLVIMRLAKFTVPGDAWDEAEGGAPLVHAGGGVPMSTEGKGWLPPALSSEARWRPLQSGHRYLSKHMAFMAL